MAEYIPTPGPHPGEQWVPSNGADGYALIDSFCCNCQRDRACSEGIPEDDCEEDELCPILGASFRGEAVEWRELPDETVTCIAFVPVGQAIPLPRCERTQDLFGDAP